MTETVTGLFTHKSVPVIFEPPCISERNTNLLCAACKAVTYPGILFGGGGGSTNSVEDRGQKERGSGDGSPLVRGSRDSCNLVQEISFHIVKVS